MQAIGRDMSINSQRIGPDSRTEMWSMNRSGSVQAADKDNTALVWW